MSPTRVAAPTSAGRRITAGLARRGVAVVRGLALAGVGLVGLLWLALYLVFVVPGFGLGLVFLVPLPILAGRPLARLARRLVGAWSGVPVPEPYRPRPPAPTPEPDGRYLRDNRLYRRAWWPRFADWLDWLLGDTASYRDLAWALTAPVFGVLLGGLPAALVVGGAGYALAAGAGYAGMASGGHWWAAPVGIAAAAGGLAVAPGLLRLHLGWTRRLLGPARATEPGRLRRWYGRTLLVLLRLLTLLGLTLLGVPLAALAVLGLLLGYGAGIVVLLPPAIVGTRWLPELRRRLARSWSGREVPSPYLPEPTLPEPRPDGHYRVGNTLYRTERWAAYHQRMSWLTRDPGTWRDMLWLLIDPLVGGLLLAAPLGALGYGIFGLALPRIWMLLGVRPEDGGDWYAAVAGVDWAAVPVGVALAGLGVALAPAALRWHGRWTALLLGPTERARLAQRVRRLTETRADATETQAAELRRIERDLHDGAQARLVAMGITLSNIDYLIDRDPAAARALLAEARDNSAKALAELRDLVRGIHPPVLAERGLADAVRALAMDLPLRARVTVELPGRAEPPIESAAYFAVSELLSNVAKHAHADRVEVDLRYADGRLRIRVCDDGRGGARPDRGSGLRGIERRLGTFDGVVDVHSPPGGPTIVTLELPCVLSSPRTSTS